MALTKADVAGGGTGTTSLTDHGVVLGSGAGAVSVTSAGTSGQVLTSGGSGADPDWAAAAGGAISNIQQWLLDSEPTLSASTWTLLSGWSEQSESWYGEIGTAMAESSGIWTFPTTGLWKVEFKAVMYDVASSRMFGNQIYVTTNNSDYAAQAQGQQSSYATGSSNGYGQPLATMLLNVSNVTNVKIKLYAYSQDVTAAVSATSTGSSITFTRVGAAD